MQNTKLTKNECGDVFSEEDFLDSCEDGMLTDYDGHGYWSDQNGDYDRNFLVVPSKVFNSKTSKFRKYQKPDYAVLINNMLKTFETEDLIISYDETESLKQEIFDRFIAFIKQLDCYNGEGLIQCDETHIESPSFIAELVDEVLKPQIIYKDDINITVGDYIILNDTDKPCTRLIAKVTDVDYLKNKIKAEYICERTNMIKCYGSLDRATKVEDFGVDLQFEKGYVTAVQNRRSIATYPDGEPREWQPQGESPKQKLR